MAVTPSVTVQIIMHLTDCRCSTLYHVIMELLKNRRKYHYNVFFILLNYLTLRRRRTSRMQQESYRTTEQLWALRNFIYTTRLDLLYNIYTCSTDVCLS